MSHHGLLVSPSGSGSEQVFHQGCEASSKYSCCCVSSWSVHQAALTRTGCGWNNCDVVGIKIRACSWYSSSLEGKGPLDDPSQESHTSSSVYRQGYLSSLFLAIRSIPILMGTSHSYSSSYMSHGVSVGSK